MDYASLWYGELTDLTMYFPSTFTHIIDSETILSVKVAGSQSNTLPSLVLLHFWGGSSSSYSSVIQRLDGYHCIAPDFRGWGKSTGPKDPSAYSISDLASDTLSVLTTPGVIGDAGYILVGHCMGAKVAQYLAAQSPSGLRGLLLIGPPPLSRRVVPEYMREAQRHAYDDPHKAEYIIRNIFCARPTADPKFVQTVIEESMRGSIQAKKAWPDYVQAEDYVNVAKDITAPVKVVAGKEDKVESLQRIRKEVLAPLIHAQRKELVVVEGAGHLMPLEVPGTLALEIKRFVVSLEH